MPEIIVITGASDGIGAAAARALSASGRTVVIVGRSAEKTKRVADSLGIFGDRTITEDGHELTLQVNHLAPFLLTTLLMDRLVESRARVINTSSVANLSGNIDIADLDLAAQFSAGRAYSNAKLDNILFTKELDRRFRADGISTAAFHPGVVASNFASESTSPLRVIYRSILRHTLISNEKGADTLIWLATTTPGSDWTSGEYFIKRKPGRINRQADDEQLAGALWERSAAMVS